MSTPSKVFCSSCGVENLPGAKFCSACGAAMGAAVVTRAPASGPTVVREGLALGIPTPVNALLLERIRRLTTGPLSENALPSLVGQP